MKNNFFKKKKNIFIVGVLALVLITAVVILVVFLKNKARENEKPKFALDPIYDVYPEDVRKLYIYMVNISCQGDLYFDIEVDKPATSVLDLDINTITNYTFSYLEKKDLLDEKIDLNKFAEAANTLFANKVNVLDSINGFSYGGYLYTVDNKTVTRKKTTCESEIEYVSQLYGYSFNKEVLSVDVNMGYEKNDKLYSLEGKELGVYKTESDLFKLYSAVSYYRYNFLLDGDTYKLVSVEWKNKV